MAAVAEIGQGLVEGSQESQEGASNRKQAAVQVFETTGINTLSRNGDLVIRLPYSGRK